MNSEVIEFGGTLSLISLFGLFITYFVIISKLFIKRQIDKEHNKQRKTNKPICNG